MRRQLVIVPMLLLSLSRAGEAQGERIQALGYSAPVPAGWATRPPASSMRLAEFTIPGKGGTPEAEVVLYFFGTGQGGAVDANLARWRGQFSNPSGGAVPESIVREATGAFPVTIAEWTGTYARGVGPGGEARPHHTLVAAIAETPKGTLFFQLFGPTAGVRAAREAYLKMVRGLK